MKENIYILGGEQSDFAINWSRQQKNIDTLIQETVYQAADQLKLDLNEVESVHIGNFIAELSCGQGLLGGVAAEAVPEFKNLPIGRHEAACASGSIAAMSAIKDLLSGQQNLSCVIGVEYMRNVSGDVAAKQLGSAAWQGQEAQDIPYVWPHMFNLLSQEYEKRYGLNYEHIAAIAKNNFENGKLNPNAQTRNWDFNEASFCLDDEHNPIVDGLVRRNDCGQVTDGAAVLFLANESYAKQYAKKRNLSLDTIPKIKAGNIVCSGISYANKIADSKDQPLVFPHVKAAIDKSFQQANMQLADIDLIETHDCFAITEYMAIDHFGITAPGESWKAVENESIKIGGSLPINPSGGLIGLGHPVGATGARMLLDAWKQCTHRAGAYQVENTKNVATLNIGGSATTVGSFIVGL